MLQPFFQYYRVDGIFVLITVSRCYVRYDAGYCVSVASANSISLKPRALRNIIGPLVEQVSPQSFSASVLRHIAFQYLNVFQTQYYCM